MTDPNEETEATEAPEETPEPSAEDEGLESGALADDDEDADEPTPSEQGSDEPDA